MWVVVCLITQGFSVEGQENLQEILSKQLLLCQFLTALSTVRTGDSLPHFFPPSWNLMLYTVFLWCLLCLFLFIYFLCVCFQEATLCVRRLTCSHPSVWVWSTCCISASRECRSSNQSPADLPTLRGVCPCLFVCVYECVFVSLSNNNKKDITVSLKITSE